MKSVLLGFTCLLGVSLYQPASASDAKTFSATSCQPYGTTTAADVSYSGYGVANKSTTTEKAVICPLVYDYEGAWTSPNGATIYLGFSAGATSGHVFCTVYLGTKKTGLVSQSVNSGWIAPNTSSDGSYSMFFAASPSAPGYPGLPIVAVCTLAPRTTLNALWVVESGATQL